MEAEEGRSGGGRKEPKQKEGQTGRGGERATWEGTEDEAI